MNWARTISGKILLAIIAAGIFFAYGAAPAAFFVFGIIAANVDFSVFMADDHSTWFAKTSNVPAWGMWVVGIIAIIIGAPMLAEIAGTIWAAFAVSFQVIPCITMIVLLGIGLGFLMLNRRRLARLAQEEVDNL